MKKILISIVGPTAIGKTKLSIALAKHFNTEIISADSRQFYKEMSIGTAVPLPIELAAVPHHFIQHKSIFDTYSVGDFEREALSRLDSLFINNEVVLMVGGSGLYVDAITKGLDKFPQVGPKIRLELNEIFNDKGIKALQDELKDLDKDYYDKVDLGNPHRMIRALEICRGTGRPYSSFLNKGKTKRPFDTITIGINADREIIYDRIDQRVDAMMKQGLLKEAKPLYEHRKMNAMQTVSYKELFKYFEGEWDLDFSISEIKKNSRRFSKRQLTWFKKDATTLWFQHTTTLDKIVQIIQEKLNISKNG
ncbi:MAG: tRNA (adenosine(37)-N6)-dimethylallyltransferase MiaA [Flavobacteriaceae bacterium]